MHSFYNDGQTTSLKISILLVAWLFPHGCTYKHMDITFTVIMGNVSINSFEFHQLLFLVAHRIVSWKSLTQTVTYSPFSSHMVLARSLPWVEKDLGLDLLQLHWKRTLQTSHVSASPQIFDAWILSLPSWWNLSGDIV